jgi:hypothetical protein
MVFRIGGCVALRQEPTKLNVELQVRDRVGTSPQRAENSITWSNVEIGARRLFPLANKSWFKCFSLSRAGELSRMRDGHEYIAPSTTHRSWLDGDDGT